MFTGSAVDLDGWFLTDDATILAKWRLPPVTLGTGERLVIFASGKDRAGPGEELHTNFKLKSAGEYLALVEADGFTIAHDYAPAYPPQYPDVSFGVTVAGAETVPLIGPGAPARFHVPTTDADDVNNPAVVTAWNDPAFDDTGWRGTALGIGYEDTDDADPYYDFIGASGDVRGVMDNQRTSAYIRVPFTVDDPAEVTELTLLMRYDDNMAKNYYVYRDSDGTGEWTQIAWDTDLAWGSHFMTGDSSAHDGIWATADYVLGGSNQNVPISPSHPFVGTAELPANRSWNRLIDKLHGNPRFAEMFRRRLRTVTDEVLAAPALDARIVELESQLAPDAAEDRAKWGQFGRRQPLERAIEILEVTYLAPRRGHLLETHLDVNAGWYPTPETSSALLPAMQSGTPQIDFESFDGNPVSGNQEEEFVEFQNPNGFAVDLSGWSVAGGIVHEFRPGTVALDLEGVHFTQGVTFTFGAGVSLAPGEFGILVRDAALFPEAHVLGVYAGGLKNDGEQITLRDAAGENILSFEYSGAWLPPAVAGGYSIGILNESDVGQLG